MEYSKSKHTEKVTERMALLISSKTGKMTPTFSDAAQIDAYAKPGVDFVTALGIMNGNANGTFSPKTNITREQAVITMMNVIYAL